LCHLAGGDRWMTAFANLAADITALGKRFERQKCEERHEAWAKYQAQKLRGIVFLM